MMLEQALMEENKKIGNIGRLYGVNDERTQMANKRYLQMINNTQMLICRTLHDYNGIIMQKLKEDGSKKRMFNHIKRLMGKHEQKNEYQDFKWQCNNCE